MTSDGVRANPADRVILRPDSDDEDRLDDVVVRDVRMFRAEMMSDTEMWMSCFLDDRQDEMVTFWVRATKRRGKRLALEFTLTDNTSKDAS